MLERFLKRYRFKDFKKYGQGNIGFAVQRSLLDLYDHRGMSRQVVDLLGQINQNVDLQWTDRLQLDRQFGYCDILGNRFDAQLETIDGRTWSSQDHLGKPVLFHFWSDQQQGWDDAQGSLAALRQLRDRLGGTLEIVSIWCSANQSKIAKISQALKAKSLKVDWSVCCAMVGDDNLQHLFSVQTLPRYVLINAQGQIEAVGSSLAILKQVMISDQGGMQWDTSHLWEADKALVESKATRRDFNF